MSFMHYASDLSIEGTGEVHGLTTHWKDHVVLLIEILEENVVMLKKISSLVALELLLQPVAKFWSIWWHFYSEA